MFHFSPLFGFIFTVWLFTAGESSESGRESGRRQTMAMSRIHVGHKHMTGQNTHDLMAEPTEFGKEKQPTKEPFQDYSNNLDLIAIKNRNLCLGPSVYNLYNWRLNGLLQLPHV